jgi:hypothetical protein
VLSYYYLEALVIHVRYGLPIIFFTPHLRTVDRVTATRAVIGQLIHSASGAAEFVEAVRSARKSLRSFADLADLLLEIPELIALPRSFEAPEIRQDPRVTYIGACVDPRRFEPELPGKGR